MRKRSKKQDLTVTAIAGTHVVLLGFDMPEAATVGLLGFAIRRTDHTENEEYWLQAFKTFESVFPNPPIGSQVSTREHPIQDFRWGDYTAKPDHDYTYRIMPIFGTPKKIVEGKAVDLNIRTESEEGAVHTVFFNRGVAGSQAYMRKFGDKKPGREEEIWLSRGLEEALIGFIDRASDPSYSLRASIYELSHEPVVEAFARAIANGADVRVVIDERVDGDSTSDSGLAELKRVNAARALLKAHGIKVGTSNRSGAAISRKSNPSYISHNKFIVLLQDQQPLEVWTGSTNLTPGGVFGQANVGHVVRDPAVAEKYLDYWHLLVKDPEAKGLRSDVGTLTPFPTASPPVGITPLFSPRKGKAGLKWYADQMSSAKAAVCFTAAFTVAKVFEDVLTVDADHLRLLLLEKAVKNLEALENDFDVRVAVGGTLKGVGPTLLTRWLEEQPRRRNTHVVFVHLKFMLVDPLSDDPIVITGSANFSDASTTDNDENMIVIRGDTRVSDLYLGEFMRLWYHHYFRWIAKRLKDAPDQKKVIYLRPDDSWVGRYFQEGSVKQKERLLFAEAAV